MILHSCEYRKLSSNCPILNRNEIDDCVHVKLPFNVNGFVPYDILDISECRAKTVSFDGVEFNDLHPWIDIPWGNVSTSVGQHVYKISLMNEKRKSFLTTYIAYIIQDDNAETPYIYMKNKYLEYDADKQGMYVGLM